MMMCPSGSTGSICLSPPKRLPIPAAMMTSVIFLMLTSLYKMYAPDFVIRRVCV